MPTRESSPPAARCGECGYENAADARSCGLCGRYLFPPEALAGSEPGDAPAPAQPAAAGAPPEPAADELSGLEAVLVRRRARAVGHGWTGAALALGITTVLGLPSSLHPLQLVLNAIAAVLFGFPLGFVASHRRLGMIGGALLGAGFGLLLALPQVLLLALDGDATTAALAPSVLVGSAAAGLIPGALIGAHVAADA